MSSFPSSIPSYAGLTASHTLQQDSHTAQTNAEQGDIVAIATKLGTGASTPTQNTVLRGNGTGTTTFDQVHLASDVSGTLPVANGGTGIGSLGAGVATFLGTPNSANLRTAVTDETGSGALTFANSPTLTTPNIADFSNANHSHANTSGGGTLGSSALQQNAVQANQLSTSAITLGYVQITTNYTQSTNTPTQITGLTLTVTIPAGGRFIKITAYCPSVFNNTNATNIVITIWDGVVGSGTQLSEAVISMAAVNQQIPMTCLAVVTPAAGSKTYNVGLAAGASGTATFTAASTNPAFLLVEAI